MRVLVVEDDVKMAALLRRGLVEDGLATDVARTGDNNIFDLTHQIRLTRTLDTLKSGAGATQESADYGRARRPI